MDWIDKKGRIGGVIHWLDLLLLVMVVVIIIRTVAFSWPRINRKEERLIRLTIMVNGLYTDQAESITIGQWVKDRNSGEFMGKIISKELVLVDRLPTGNSAQASCLKKQNIILILERSGRINEEEGIYLGKEIVRSGQERMYYTLYTEFPGRIMRIIPLQE